MLLNNEMIDKAYKAVKRSKLIGIILTVAAVLLLIYGIANTAIALKNMKHLNDVITAEEDKKGDQPAYLDMVGFMQFATYGDDTGYYIAYDDDFYYIIFMKNKDYDYVASKFDDNEYVRVYGYTRQIPYESRTYAIETLNEEAGQEIVTNANFDDLFGDVCLDVRRDGSVRSFIGPLFEINGTSALIGIGLLLVGVVMIFANRSALRSFEKYQDESPESYALAQEVNSEENKVFPKLGVILSDRHLISSAGTLQVVDYQDIFWAYLTSHRTNGISDYNFLNICTKDGQRIICGNGNTFGKKNRAATNEDHGQILQWIAENNPEARIGYTKEYVDEFADLCKAVKEKKKAEKADQL